MPGNAGSATRMVANCWVPWMISSPPSMRVMVLHAGLHAVLLAIFGALMQAVDQALDALLAVLDLGRQAQAHMERIGVQAQPQTRQAMLRMRFRWGRCGGLVPDQQRR